MLHRPIMIQDFIMRYNNAYLKPPPDVKAPRTSHNSTTPNLNSAAAVISNHQTDITATFRFLHMICRPSLAKSERAEKWS